MTITVELTLGETLRLWRERTGFSQSELAKYLKIGRTTVIRYENDLALPKWPVTKLWAEICDQDPETVREAWVERSMFGCIYGPAPDYVQLVLLGGGTTSDDLGGPAHTLAAAS